jgi:hypothetical protein
MQCLLEGDPLGVAEDFAGEMWDEQSNDLHWEVITARVLRDGRETTVFVKNRLQWHQQPSTSRSTSKLASRSNNEGRSGSALQ